MSVEMHRTFQQPLKISFGGAAGAAFWIPPVSEDRAGRTTFEVGYGARVFTNFHSEPVGEDRMAAMPLDVANGGLLKPGVTGTPLEPQRAATGRTEGAGGMFCHTHTKSKLMG